MKNYIIKNENAIYYECNYSCDNAIFIKLGSEAFFLTDSRYTQEAILLAIDVKVIESKDLLLDAKELLQKSKIKKIIYDGDDFSYNALIKLRENLKIEFKNKVKFSQKKRIIKSQKELKLLKKAATLGQNSFDDFAKYIQKNGFKKDEKFLNFKMIEKMTKKGEFDLSFAPIVAINQNASKPHALPTDKKLKKSDLLLVDSGLKYKRYCSDRTRTSYISFDDEFNFTKEQKFKSKKEQKIYDIVLKAQQTAIKKARVGMKASIIDKFTRDIITKAGYEKEFIHSTGHGVGLDIHEFPFINSKSEIIIEDGMVFTVEPGIYLPNEFGVRIEDTVAMIDGRAVIL